MIYLVGAVALVMALLGGTVWVQHANNARIATERDAAITANRTLAASIDGVRAECKTAIDKAKADGSRRTKAAADAAAKADKIAAGQRDVISVLAAQSLNAADSEANCRNAQVVLEQLAKDRAK